MNVLKPLIAAGLLAGTPASGAGSAGAFREGQPLPTLVLPDLSGRPRSLAGFRGKRTVLHVFASW